MGSKSESVSRSKRLGLRLVTLIEIILLSLSVGILRRQKEDVKKYTANIGRRKSRRGA